MKRSEINQLIRDAAACFTANGWALPPNPHWDVTDFGLGDWRSSGLVLVNLAEEPEYCEKLMYAKRGMVTPPHHHLKKKEDIICRWGVLQIRLSPPFPFSSRGHAAGMARSTSRESGEGGRGVELFHAYVNREPVEFEGSAIIALKAGERVTLIPGMIHAFEPLTEECIVGEVSTANDDLHDNIFAEPGVGRYARVEEDEKPIVRLVSDP